MTKEFISKMRELGKDPSNEEVVKEQLQQERDKNWRILKTLKPGDEVEINKEWIHENMSLSTKRPDFRNFIEDSDGKIFHIKTIKKSNAPDGGFITLEEDSHYPHGFPFILDMLIIKKAAAPRRDASEKIKSLFR